MDSLWLPENVYSPLVEPFTGMAFALSRTRRLKAGSGISVLPGRHPVLVAKQLASLAGLAPGRVLPVFGLQPAQPAERALFARARRASAPPCSTSRCNCCGCCSPRRRCRSTGRSSPSPTPASARCPAKPLDIWLGGSAPAGLRRVGRLADGWLGSLLTPAEAGAAVGVIQDAAAQAGREVDPDHFGLSLPVALERHPGRAAGLDPPPPAGHRPGRAGRGRLGRRPPDDRAVRRGRAEQVRGAPGRRPGRSARSPTASCGS